MGYRSDVAALFYAENENYPPFKLFFKENFPHEEWGGCVTEFKNKYTQGFKFYCEDVKWYDSYESVQKFEAFMDKLKELTSDYELGWCYEFCRVGEEYNDIDFVTEGKVGGLLGLNRSIYFDV